MALKVRNTGASTGTLTGDGKGMKIFPLYGVPMLWRTSENIRIRARAFSVKVTGVYTCKCTVMRTGMYANFFLKGTIYNSSYYAIVLHLRIVYMELCDNDRNPEQEE